MFPFETWEQCTFFFENFAVNLNPVNVVARALVVRIRIECLGLWRI